MAKLTRQEELKLQKEMEDKKKMMLTQKEGRIKSEVDKVIKEFNKTTLRGDEKTELIKRIKDQLK